MSEMQVSMRLTLQDIASGPLKEFADQLRGLTGIARTLNDRLAPLQRSLRDVGSAAAQSTGGFDKMVKGASALGDAMARVDRRVATTAESFAQFGANAESSAAGMAKFQDAIVALGDVVAGMKGRLASAMEGMDALAGSAVAAARATELSAGKMDAATGAMSRMKGEAHDLTHALQGMAEMWAAIKIKQGLGASVRTASSFETQVAQLRSLGLSGGQIQYAQQQAWRATGAVPYVSAADALAARRAIIAGTGQNNEALMNAALPRLLQDAYAYKNLLGSKSSLADIIGNFAGLAEARGMSQSAGGLTAAADQALQIALATQGRMKAAQQEIVARQFKYGGAQLVNEAGYKNVMALAEQYTLAGHEGGGGGGGRGVSQVGTAFGMVLKTILGGRMNKVTQELLTSMGMFNPGVVTGSTSTTATNTFGTLRQSTEAESNPAKWVHEVLVPRMLAYAMKHAAMYFPAGDTKSPEAQKLALDRLAVQMFGPTGGVNVSNMIAMLANPAIYSRMENTRTLSDKTAVGSQAVNETNQYAKSVHQFTAALDNLKVAMGDGLLPILTPLINGLARVVEVIGQALHSAPQAAAAIDMFAVALGTMLGIKGFNKLFGSIRSVFGVMGKLAPAAEEAESGVAKAATGMAAKWGARVAAMGAAALRFAGWVGIAFTLYEASAAIQWGGVTLQSRFNAILDTMAMAVNKFLQYVTRAFSAIGDVLAAPLSAMQAVAARLGATGFAAKMGSDAKWMRQRSAIVPNFFRDNAAYWGDQAVSSLTPNTRMPRRPNQLPDNEALVQAAQANIAQGLVGQMGPMPTLGGGRRGRAAHHASAQDLAAGWGLSDLHRAVSEAQRQADAWQRQMQDAQRAVSAAIAPKSNKWRRYASILSAGGQPALAAQAQALADKEDRKAALATAQGHLSSLQTDLRNTQQTNAALVTAGVLTPDQAQAKTLQAQRDAAPHLEAAAAKVEELARALGDTGLAGKMDVLRQKFVALGQGLTQLQQKVSNTVQGSFEGLFSSLMRGKKTWKQMGADFVNSILNGMNHSISQNLSQGLVQGLFGANTGAGQALRGFGGSGGVMSSVGSWIGNMFKGSGSGGAASATAGSASGGFWSGIGTWLAGIGSSYAAGTDYVPHDMVAQIHQGEMIVPKDAAGALRAGGLGGNQVHLTIHAMDSQSVLGAMDNIKRELAGMLNSANQNLNLGA